MWLINIFVSLIVAFLFYFIFDFVFDDLNLSLEHANGIVILFSAFGVSYGINDWLWGSK